MTIARRQVAASAGLHRWLDAVRNDRWHRRVFVRVPVGHIEKRVDLCLRILSCAPRHLLLYDSVDGFGFGCGRIRPIQITGERETRQARKRSRKKRSCKTCCAHDPPELLVRLLEQPEVRRLLPLLDRHQQVVAVEHIRLIADFDVHVAF
jgi:hypothetical protein